MPGTPTQTDSAPLHERVQALLGIGLTQTKIAAELGVAQPTVSALAKPPSPGKKSRPSSNVVDGLRRLEAKHARKLAQRGRTLAS